jgi:hypothetical protein
MRRHNYLIRVARSAVKGAVDEVDRRAERLERSPQTLDGISSGRSHGSSAPCRKLSAPAWDVGGRPFLEFPGPSMQQDGRFDRLNSSDV